MDPEAIRALYDEDERQNAAPPGMRREHEGGVTRLIHVAEPRAKCFIPHSALDARTAEAAIAREVAYFAALGRTVEWKLYDYDQPVDLGLRLARQGFAPGEVDTILALALADAPTSLTAVETAAVRRVAGPDDLEAVRRVLAEVWDKDFDWFKPRMSRLMAAGYALVYLAELDGETAAASWLLLEPGSRFAGLWGGSTRAAFRGRGLYRAMLAARAREAAARGRLFLTIDAGEMSRPIVERQGFAVIATAQEYVWSPPQSQTGAAQTAA